MHMDYIGKYKRTHACWVLQPFLIEVFLGDSEDSELQRSSFQSETVKHRTNPKVSEF